MSWGMVAVGGATLLSGALQSNAAGKAADEQSASAQAGIAEQREARRSFEQRSEPFRQIGLSAAPALAELLGISMPTQEELALQQQIASIDRQIQGGPQTVETRPGGVKGFFESALGMHGGSGFLETIKQPLQIDRGGPLNFSAGERQLPFNRDDLTGERQRLQQQLDEMQRNRAATSQSGRSLPLLEEVNPLVNFVRNQGFSDIQESAAAQGRLRSGGTLQDLSEFNTNLAATVVPQLQQQRFNQLFNVLGLGQNAAVGQGSAALSTASNIGDLLGQQGQAQAANSMQQGQIGANTISGLAGVYGAQQAGAFNRPGAMSGGLFNTGSQTDFATGAVSSPIPNRFGGFI